MSKVKSVSLADAISKLEQNPEIQAMLQTLKARQKASPARHNRQFNIELVNISAELNGRCKIVGMLTDVILDNDYDDADRNSAYERRVQEIRAIADLQTRYDKLVAELDQAIIDEDNAKVS